MRIVIMLLYLAGDDVVKLPVTLTADQSCSDKLIQMVQEDLIGTSVYYKGQQVLAYYCKKGTGEYVK
jgi:hypothetical protein|tara:strand:- start:410 stop:610 length:201 start_codon:yes stop_codon:yes gene_type:complete